MIYKTFSSARPGNKATLIAVQGGLKASTLPVPLQVQILKNQYKMSVQIWHR